MKITIKNKKLVENSGASASENTINDVLRFAASSVYRSQVFTEPYRLNRFYDEDIARIKKAIVSKALQILGKMGLSVDPKELDRKAALTVNKLISGKLEILESEILDQEADTLRKKLADIKVQKAKKKLDDLEAKKKKISK